MLQHTVMIALQTKATVVIYDKESQTFQWLLTVDLFDLTNELYKARLTTLGRQELYNKLTSQQCVFDFDKVKLIKQSPIEN